MTLESSARLFADSKNDLTTRDSVVTIQQGAVIQPPANPTPDATTPYCCNNGQLDPGEDCEDGNQAWCDGCVPNQCRFEVPCPGDGDPCTGDTCLPTVGCQPLSGPPCASDGHDRRLRGREVHASPGLRRRGRLHRRLVRAGVGGVPAHARRCPLQPLRLVPD